MKIDGHYYAVLAFCRACGFKKESAHEIAFASQYVDDAKVNQIELDAKPPPGIEHELIGNRPAFLNMATCHYYDRANTFNFDAMLNNTCAFHFVPGGVGETFVRKLACVPGSRSKIMQDLVKDVLEVEDPIALGVVLHAYADSFSHQGFSGLLSKINRVEDFHTGRFSVPTLFSKLTRRLSVLRAFVDKVFPPYGHLQVHKLPDTPFVEWGYSSDSSEDFTSQWVPIKVSNPERYREAFEGIRRILDDYLEKHPEQRDSAVPPVDFDKLFSTLKKRGPVRWRVRTWRKVLVDDTKLLDKADVALRYRKTAWLEKAFDNYDRRSFNRRTIKHGVPAKTGFAESPWYRFYVAVKWYKDRLYDRSCQHGLNLYGMTCKRTGDEPALSDARAA